MAYLHIFRIYNYGNGCRNPLIAAAGIDDHRQLTAIHSGVRPRRRHSLCPDTDAFSFHIQKNASDIGSVISPDPLFCDGPVIINLALQHLSYILDVHSPGKIQNVLHIQKAPVRKPVLRFSGYRLLFQNLSVFLYQNNIGMVIGDPHSGIGNALIKGNHNIKGDPIVNMLYCNGNLLHKFLHLRSLLAAYTGNYL